MLARAAKQAQPILAELTQEQIDQLPDDADEMAQVLEQMAGPGAMLRVNGFSGGRLPPKSQIAEIRFRFRGKSGLLHESGQGVAARRFSRPNKET